MILKALLAFVLSFLLGFFATSLVWPDRLRNCSLVLRCCLGIGLGFGISSCWFFIWLCLGGANRATITSLVLPELAVIVALGLRYFAFKGNSRLVRLRYRVTEAGKTKFESRLFSFSFYLVLTCAVLSFFLISLRAPHGNYDAMSTWNLRAKFLADGAAQWRDAFLDSRYHSRANLDYPLLLPATIARCWVFMGHDSVLVPISVAFLFTFSLVGLLCSSLALLRNKRIAYLGGIVLLGVYSFVELGAWQYADVVIGWFILATIVILTIYETSPTNQTPWLLALAGAAAGLSAWSKNEGQMFLLLVLAVRLSSFAWRKDWKLLARQSAATMSGLLPVLAVLAYFKLAVAPPNSWVHPVTSPTIHAIQYFLDPAPLSQKITDVHRYWTIAKAMLGEILHLGGRTLGITPLLLLYLLLSRVHKSSFTAAKTALVLLGLMLVGYFCVYLVTPLSLTYHLNSSLSRLLLQLWPSMVFAFFMAVSPAPMTLQDSSPLVTNES